MYGSCLKHTGLKNIFDAIFADGSKTGGVGAMDGNVKNFFCYSGEQEQKL